MSDLIIDIGFIYKFIKTINKDYRNHYCKLVARIKLIYRYGK